MERVMQLESLEGTFIPEVFKERTWTKLLNGDRIECWVRHNEFVITRDSIQEYLEIRPPFQPISVQYEDRLGSIADMVEILSGTPKKSFMNTIPFFSPEIRALAHVMIHKLYSITNLTTLSAGRTKFLYDLFTRRLIYVDISFIC